MNELWTALAAAAGIELKPAQHDRLSHFLDLLFVANSTMNLTRITDRPAAELQHVADALTVLPYLPTGAHRLADVGSGGGVPGIPLAIVRPEVEVLLIESTKKKAAFLASAARDLDLTNVRVTDRRAEDVGLSPDRETFDVAVARAVATMDWLAEYCLPLVKKGGRMLAMKGPKVAEELPEAAAAIKLLGGSPAVSHAVQMPEVAGIAPDPTNHVIVEIRKTAKTPPKFPRPASQAKGKPLRRP